MEEFENKLDLNHQSDLFHEDGQMKKKTSKNRKNKKVLLKGEDDEKKIYLEHFESTPISVDTTKMNQIENELKDTKNIANIPTEDLIYYISMKSQNDKLDSTNYDATYKYLNQIQISYHIENIFSNQTNYSTLVYAFIFLLIPLYYYYPNFNEAGFWGIAMGLFGMTMLMSSLQKYGDIGKLTGYGTQFFRNLSVYLFIFSLLFYFVFFVLMCKINHYSLFFVSLIIIYLLMTYVLRLILLSPVDDNKFKDYRATYEFNPNAVPINTTIDEACKELNGRLNLGLPSGQMLYNYIAYFQIKENKNYIWDFISYFFQPFVVIGVLYQLGTFINSYETDWNEMKIETMPLVGMSHESLDLLTCQANYILPDFVSPDEKTKRILTEKCFDQELSRKLSGVFQQIGGTYLKLYRPTFINGENKNEVVMILDPDESKRDYYMEDIMDKKTKLTEQDENIIRDNIEFINVLMDDYCREYEVIFNGGNGTGVYPYENNLIMRDVELGYKPKEYMKGILQFLSPWLLFSKVLGSGWFLSKYLLAYWTGDYGDVLGAYDRDWIVWRYSSMGVDRKKMMEWTDNDMKEISWKKIGLGILLMLFVCTPFLTSLTNMVGGFNFSPKYINNVWGLIVMGNFIGNNILYQQGESLTKFNMIYVISALVIMISVSVGIMMSKKE